MDRQVSSWAGGGLYTIHQIAQATSIHHSHLWSPSHNPYPSISAYTVSNPQLNPCHLTSPVHPKPKYISTNLLHPQFNKKSTAQPIPIFHHITSTSPSPLPFHPPSSPHNPTHHPPSSLLNPYLPTILVHLLTLTSPSP